MVAKALSFGRAAGCVVLGVEVENDALAPQGRKRDGFAGIALKGEVGGGSAGSKFLVRHLKVSSDIN